MNGYLWNVVVKQGYEFVLPKLIQEELQEKQIPVEIYQADHQDLIILITLKDEQMRSLFDESLTFMIIQRWIHQMCTYEECSLAYC